MIFVRNVTVSNKPYSAMSNVTLAIVIVAWLRQVGSGAWKVYDYDRSLLTRYTTEEIAL